MAWKRVTWAERKFLDGGKYFDRKLVKKAWLALSSVSVKIKGFRGMGAPGIMKLLAIKSRYMKGNKQ